MKAGVVPADGRDLSALRAVGSTGSPLVARGLSLGLRPARLRHVAVLDLRAAPTCARRSSAACRRCRCTSASCRRARSGARSRRGIPTGRPLIDEVGELVITEPMPSMPIGFWGDDDGSRYRESLLRACTRASGATATGSRSPSRGTAVIYGRSDSTINRGGVRMGTSEIYRAVLAVPDVLDALVDRRPDGRARRRMDAAVRRPARRRRRWTSAGCRDPPADPRGLLAAPRARRDPADLRGAADAVGQGARGSGQADPDRDAGREAASRESLANPAALDYFVELAAAR